MTLRPTQSKSGTPRNESRNPVKKAGRPDHPTVLDGDAPAGKIGKTTTSYPDKPSTNPVKRGGRPSGMADQADLGQPSGQTNQITTYNSRAFVRPGSHSFTRTDKISDIGTPSTGA